MPEVRVGSVLYGYCGGYFGRDSYQDKRVEAIGADWVVARELGSGEPVIAYCSTELLAQYLTEDPEG